MILAGLQQVFRKISYGFYAVTAAFALLSGILLLPHRQLIFQVLTSDVSGGLLKLSFVVNLYGTIASNYTLFSAFFLVLLVVLFGINVALLIYYTKRSRQVSATRSASILSVGGLLSAFLGVGCAACGSVILTAGLGLLGLGGLLAFLPLHGAEFSVIGVLLLCLSNWYLLKKITGPRVCETI